MRKMILTDKNGTLIKCGKVTLPTASWMNTNIWETPPTAYKLEKFMIIPGKLFRIGILITEFQYSRVSSENELEIFLIMLSRIPRFPMSNFP